MSSDDDDDLRSICSTVVSGLFIYRCHDLVFHYPAYLILLYELIIIKTIISSMVTLGLDSTHHGSLFSACWM